MKIRNFFLKLFLFSTTTFTSLFGNNFTVASYNCGGLSDHYDYIQAAGMQKLIQERHNSEPETLAQLKEIQKLALKIRFTQNATKKEAFEKEWDEQNYSEKFSNITSHPDEFKSINKKWFDKRGKTISSYKKRPIEIYDQEVREILYDHIYDLTKLEESTELLKDSKVKIIPYNAFNESLSIARRIMAVRIFQHHLKYDIIALQEADYLDPSVFPDNYNVKFSSARGSVDGVAWNKDRFELVEVIGDIVEKGFAVRLRDLNSGKIVAIASGHLTGCNPFSVEHDLSTGSSDSESGDRELYEIINTLNEFESDIQVIAMDANVTPGHPRLSILSESNYIIDYTNYIEPTCSSPWQVLETRIDWIAVRSTSDTVSIANIPVLGVCLNCPKTNMSDHKPVAAKITY
ncbi:MAG: hypothetical protein VX777_03475 [Chlamydiota bacterium]|nr:hypothetical protein [Chlamydiota bacterium]